jgi:hypothetical protein
MILLTLSSDIFYYNHVLQYVYLTKHTVWNLFNVFFLVTVFLSINLS